MGGGQSAAREGFDFVVEVERELKSSILEDKGVSYIHSGRFMKGMKKHKKILHKKDLKHIKEYLDMRPQPPVRLFKFRLARALTEKLPIKTIEEMELADARTRWVVVMLLGYCIEQPTLFHTLKFIASCLGTKDEGLEGQLLWRALYQSKSIREFHDGYPSFVNPSRVVRFLKSITRYPPSRVVPINEALFLLVEVFIARLSTILLLDICLFNHLSNVIASDILEADSNPKHAKLGVASVEAVRQTIRLGEYNIPDNVRKDILDELSLSGDVVPFSQFLPVIVEAVLRARATKLIQVDTSAQEQTMFWNRLTLVSFLRKLSSLPAWFAERFGEDIHAPQLTRDRFVQVLNELRTSTNFRISDEEIQGMWSALHWAAETPATTSIAFGHMVVTHLYTVALVRLRSNLSMFGYTLPLPPERSTWRTVDSAIPEVDMTTLTDMLITTHPFNANIHERSHAMRGSHKLFPQYLHTRTPVVHEAIKPLDCNQQNIAYAFQFDIRQLMRLMGHELPEYMSLYADPLSGLVPPIHPNNNNNNNAGQSSAATPRSTASNTPRSTASNKRQKVPAKEAGENRDDTPDDEESGQWSEVVAAIKQGNVAEVERFFTQPPLSHLKDAYPLSISMDLVDPRITHTNNKNRNLLHIACMSPESSNVVPVLMRLGFVQWSQPDTHQETPLHLACWKNNMFAVRSLLTRFDPAPSAKSLWVSGVRWMNSKNDKGKTPLHIAAHKGHADCVSQLLEEGASTTIKDDKGRTPYEYAVASGNQDVQAMLAPQ